MLSKNNETQGYTKLGSRHTSHLDSLMSPQTSMRLDQPMIVDPWSWMTHQGQLWTIWIPKIWGFEVQSENAGVTDKRAMSETNLTGGISWNKLKTCPRIPTSDQNAEMLSDHDINQFQILWSNKNS